jgi:hypothetical protein
MIQVLGQSKRLLVHNHRGDREQASMLDDIYSLYFDVEVIKRMAETLETKRFLGLTSLMSRPILKIAREKENTMLSTTTPTTQVIRNYAIAAVSVMLLSLGIGELVNNPSRIAQQNKLDGYGYYVSAGLVNYAQSSLKP